MASAVTDADSFKEKNKDLYTITTAFLALILKSAAEGFRTDLALRLTGVCNGLVGSLCLSINFLNKTASASL